MNQTYTTKSNANSIVSFLSGKWENISFEIIDGKDVKRESYHETITIKNFHTVTITAHNFKDGKDLTKDMHLELNGNDIIMSQGSFKAKGTREGNMYSLKGFFEETEYRFRLYTMGDKYVFHRETWKQGKIQQMDMSYLTRKAN